MRPFSEADIRASFLNASLRERKTLLLPDALDQTPWDALDYLGWHDRKLPQVAYVSVELDGAPASLLLRRADAKPRNRAQCSWCADVQLPNDVVLYTAKRAGDAGRRGDTVGVLVCENFECSANVRKLPPSAYLGYDREAARDRRIEQLTENVTAFARAVRDGS
ncbi:FBP domain-containing protein [Microbacterium telephonicum]|uniref:Treble-clef zinc-finger protein n=1 Tax=Microbacterium telephonicum TaxID=1714841 RepID=A0A498BWU6_9MICO|nr:FBP domain-containing protein [Microbacterium telephonicum]RLK46766.1 treble-clef zinc-finger protein [Microbacterium telephonicum]